MNIKEQKAKRMDALKTEFRKWNHLRESTETLAHIWDESSTIGEVCEWLKQLELSVVSDLRGMGEPFPVIVV